jgi:hypothetical protein
MSGVAAVGGLEATVGLIPRYLRPREPEVVDADEPPAPPPPPPIEEEIVLPGMRGKSLTDELRQRISDAAAPEKRRPKPLLFGLAAVAVIVLVVVMFPDAFAALLPTVDSSL